MLSTILWTALASAIFTLVLFALCWQFVLRPRLEKELEVKLQRRVEKGVEVLEDRVEQAVRRGVLEGVTALASKEVLQDTTRTLARSGAELVESRLNTFFGRRQRDDDKDDDS